MAGIGNKSSNAASANKGNSKTNNDGSALTNEDEAYDAIMGGDFGSMNIMGIIDNNSKEKNGSVGKNDKDEGEVEHLPDAIDFEDEDELVSDFEDEDDDDDSNNNDEEDDEKKTEDTGNKNRDNQHSQENDERQEDEGKENNLFDFNSGIDDDLLTESLQQKQMSFNKITNHTLQDKFKVLLQSLRKPKTAQELKDIQLQAYYPFLNDKADLQLSQLVKAPTVEYEWKQPLRELKPIIPNFQITVQQDTHKYYNTNKKRSVKQINRSRKNIIAVEDKLKFPELQKNKNKFTPDSSDIDEKTNEKVVIENINNTQGEFYNKFEIKNVNLDTLVDDEWDVDKLICNNIKSDTLENNVTNKNKVFTINDLEEEEKKNMNEEGVELDTALPWDNEDLIEGNLQKFIKPVVNLRDNKLLLEKTSIPAIDRKLYKPYKIIKKPNNVFKVSDKLIKQRFNMSNDHAYEILKKNYKSQIRTNVGSLTIQHAVPATRLQNPYYKTHQSKEKLRFSNRYPEFFKKMRPGSILTFSKLKTRKRKRDKGKEVAEIFEKTTDLTLGDTAPVFLMEYSERQPLGISKFGMNTKIINYYRKKDDDDQFKPKLPIGENVILGPQDKSPFWNYGQVNKGEIVSSLFNNMMRAPIVPHKPRYRDYLLVKSQGGNNTVPKYFLRDIDNLYVAGQTMPMAELPGPNTRKMNLIIKNRLKILAYRLIKNSPTQSLTLRDIKPFFKESSDMHLRSRLKEFMKFYRAADPKESDKRRAKAGGGYWKLKESETLPDDDQLKKIVTPEDLAIQDFIMSYEKFIDDNKLFNIDEKQSNLEEQLAPWNVSKNFLNSITMRTTIAISGEGDPTGLGEGFNYLRASTVSKKDSEMDEIYNKLTYQQQKQVAKPVNVSKSVYSDSDNDKSSKTTYEEELKKIWYRQQLSLSIQNPYKQLGNNANFANITHFKKKLLSSSKVPKGKVMKFVRKKRDANGIIHRETEFIKDPSLMHAYISHYEEMESNLDTEQLLKDDAKKYILGKTEQEKTDKLHAMLTKKLSEVSKRSMALSQAQVTKKINKQKKSETTPVKKNVKERKPSSRTCTACGQLGHIKTNKICPLFQQK